MTPMTTDRPMSNVDRTEQVLRRAIDRIYLAYGPAVDDSRARGYPGGVDYNNPGSGGSIIIENEDGDPERIPATAVEIAALRKNDADRWLKLVEKMVRDVLTIANMGQRLWPPTPQAGTRIRNITVGGRTNQIETCCLCAQPVAGGHDDPIRRIDGDPYHKSPCWYVASRSRGVHPTQKQAG
jgi:hypothetical protein